MHSPNSVANFAEAAVHDFFRAMDWRVIGFTASIVNGRRYIGVEADGQQFFVEINVADTAESSPMPL